MHLRGYGWITVFSVCSKKMVAWITLERILKSHLVIKLKVIVKARWSIEVYHRELKQTCVVLSAVRLVLAERRETILAYQLPRGLISINVSSMKKLVCTSKMGCDKSGD
ncbi:hypothetical protein [Piscirickettsia salmonis]|uniref:hypothetical protein n=1 Tax=Piscirickettsia salmonis TaxID=1238 RepID=UPI0018C59805|nr:hypothetical protein [Piscirickettsia salmonis]